MCDGGRPGLARTLAYRLQYVLLSTGVDGLASLTAGLVPDKPLGLSLAA